MAGLDHPESLFQPRQLYDSMEGSTSSPVQGMCQEGTLLRHFSLFSFRLKRSQSTPPVSTR